MKKTMSSFLAGAISTLLIGGICITALASNEAMTIEVSPINIQVNGSVFSPTDVNGQPVSVFTYNGTTYAPLRALAEAYDLDVWYDSSANIAAVGPKGSAPTSTPTSTTESAVTATAKGPIRIFMVDKPGVNSAGGVNVSINWNNFSGKTIKYIRFYVTPYNRVGDKLKCSITGISNAECYAVGPFENVSPDMDWTKNSYLAPLSISNVATKVNSNGTYAGYAGSTIQVDWDNMYDIFMINEWQCVWYNYDVAEVRLTKIKIEYMDGTVATLTGDALQACYW